MRLRASAGNALLGGLAPESGTGRRSPFAGPLLGSWAATRWEYASITSRRVVDLVCDLGGSVTLSVSPGTYILTWDIARQGRRSVGGTVEVRASALHLHPHDGVDEEVVLFQLADDTLTLSAAQSAWAFDGNGEEPAAFTAVLVRL